MEKQHELGTQSAGGEMARRVQEFNWSETSLGPMETWPRSLRIALRIVTDSRYPMFIWWGEELIYFYNDAYARMTLGAKHPWALGRSAREVWAEIWDDLSARLETVLRTRQATWDEELLLILERSGFPEETYHTFSYSPILSDDSGDVGGILCCVTEDTLQVLNRRRLRTLRELADQTTNAKTVDEACEAAIATLADNPNDLPFTLLYLLDAEGTQATLAGVTGVGYGSPACPTVVRLTDEHPPWPFHEVVESGHSVEVSDLVSSFGALPGGPWPDSPQRAVVLPVTKAGQGRLAGFIVAGLGPRLKFDDDYRGFLEMLAGQIAGALGNAHAYEEERRRAEALTELDRAKTTFFTNISHEFRTPLTLILAPLEDALAEMEDGSQRDRLRVLQRNALRLQKLVNTLLDFSRIQAGRVEASYEPVDLALFTVELAGVFRSAVEKAGMRLVVNCPPLSEPVYVDRSMWEKIVLNLVSNAFKFTLEGEIEVSLHESDDVVELSVRDTGVGIAEEQLPHLFRRFHRVETSRARTHEGTGIGLALVDELTRLHGGTVGVQSRWGWGSTFTVTIPRGTAHLPVDKIEKVPMPRLTPLAAGHYVEEAARWLPDGVSLPAECAPEVIEERLRESDEVTFSMQDATEAPARRPRIVWADDNADMRQYVTRLLGASYDVEAVSNGEAAWDAVRRSIPDLVLTDIMMPRLDGFGLLRELRADERTRSLPVILLSARAGEEARIEGMQAGADDYLTKPFSSRELLVRVATHLEIARARRQSESEVRRLNAELEARLDELNTLLEILPTGVFIGNKDCSEIIGNPAAYRVMGFAPGINASVTNAESQVPAGLRIFVNGTEVAPQDAPMQQVARTGKPLSNFEQEVLFADGTRKTVYGSIAPLFDEHGAVRKVIAAYADFSKRKREERALRESNDLFRSIVDTSPLPVWMADPHGRIEFVNPAYLEFFGITPGQAEGFDWRTVLHPDDADAYVAAFEAALAERRPFTASIRARRADGRWCRLEIQGIPHFDEAGRMTGYSGCSSDRTDIMDAQELLYEAGRRKDEFLVTLTQELRNPLASISNSMHILRLSSDVGPTATRIHEMLERQVKTLVHLVDDLLEISRISTGKVELRKETVDLAAVLRVAVETSRSFIESAGHRLTISIPAETFTLEADPVRLAQVFTNLLNNAARYTEPGGTIRINVCRSDDMVAVTVQDTGIGISAGVLPHIFEMFVQGEGISAHAGGLGIGLTLVRSMVEMHGGSIQAHSDGAGLGSEFVVRLPLAIGASADNVRSAEHFTTLRSSRRVLVVDDNHDAADTLGTLLKYIGADVRVVYDGPAALDVFEEYNPDIMVLDISMSGMDGYEVARRIKEHPQAANVMLIALTGWSQDKDQGRSRSAGFDHHLTKPANINTLQALLVSPERRQEDGPVT